MKQITSASPWSNAEAFYRDRDHRTQIEVPNLRSYCSVPVEIHVDPSAAEDATLQRAVIVACNLTARWARNIRVVVPNVSLVGPLRYGADKSLSHRIAREMRNADPFGDFEIGEHYRASLRRDPLRLWIGAGDLRGASELDYVVDAAGWSVIGQRAVRWKNISRTQATAPAAALAGAIGAADLFKRAIGHPPARWFSEFNWCTWDNNFSNDPLHLPFVPAAPESVDTGNILLAGVGAVGSALIYILGLMPLTGRFTVLDIDCVETSNLNRSPLFSADDAAAGRRKTSVAKRFLGSLGIQTDVLDGSWAEHSESLSRAGLDAWISLTNEHAAWAQVPFQLPPVVLHGTTTSGWGAGFGRHIPRKEDCTACRMPRPFAEFRGPCAEGNINTEQAPPLRASLPFLSSVSAALIATELLKLDMGVQSPGNSISVDFLFGLRSVVSTFYGANPHCPGCRMAALPLWVERGGKSRYAKLSAA